MSNVLLIDDDQELCQLLSSYLSKHNINTSSLHSAEAALASLDNNTDIDVIVLDIMMPGMSGLEALPILAAKVDIPIIMLTGRGEEIDRIIGLEMGADDYLSKPCNPRELLARINSILRRGRKNQDTRARQFSVGGVSADNGNRKASSNGQPLNLTSTEFDILILLLENAGQAVSKDELTEKVLHRKLSAYDRAIDVHVSRLRKKLQTSGQAEMISTIRGGGYQFVSHHD